MDEFVVRRPKEADYVCAMSEEGYDDAGYISVLALESEITRRKTCKNRKYNPNITSKSGIEFLTGRDVPSMISTLPRDSYGISKQRSPAPLPRVVPPSSGKNPVEIPKRVPAIQVDSSPRTEHKNESDYEAPEINKDLNNNAELNSLEREICPEELTIGKYFGVLKALLILCSSQRGKFRPYKNEIK